MIHLLTQSVIGGKAPYANLVSAKNEFLYSPVHTDDIANAVASALASGPKGAFSLNGSTDLNLNEIKNILQENAGTEKTRGPMFPPLDYVFDFFTGTTSDLNMSRMVAYFEENRHLHNQLHANPWTETTPSVDFK